MARGHRSCRNHQSALQFEVPAVAELAECLHARRITLQFADTLYALCHFPVFLERGRS